MNPFKIKTESEEHSKEIQEWLLSKVSHLWPKDCSMVLEGCKELYYGEIGCYISGCTEDSESFEEHPFPEKWFYGGQLHDNPEISKDPRSFLMLLLGTNEDIEHKNRDGVWETFAVSSDYRIRPKTRYCNGVELDECIKEPLENGDMYHIANPLGNGYSSVLFWDGGDNDFKYKIRGIAYLREESAVKHAKAMLNIPY